MGLYCRSFSVLCIALIVSLGIFVNLNWGFALLLCRLARTLPVLMPPAVIKNIQLLMAERPVGEPLVVMPVPAKQGTTWLGHVVYQTRCRGAAVNTSRTLMADLPYPDFKDDVLGGPLTQKRMYMGEEELPFWELNKGVHPHVLRTHSTMSTLKQAGIDPLVDPEMRVITIIRDPLDAIISFWRFLSAILHVPHEEVSLSLFARLVVWLKHDEELQNIVDLWNARNNSNVLVMLFEDMKSDLKGSVRRVAEHLQITPPLTVEELTRITEQSTNAAMSGELAARFKDPDRAAEMLGLSKEKLLANGGIKLVRKGGGGKEGEQLLPEAVKSTMQAKWTKIVTQQTGLRDFQHLQATLRSERKSG